MDHGRSDLAAEGGRSTAAASAHFCWRPQLEPPFGATRRRWVWASLRWGCVLPRGPWAGGGGAHGNRTLGDSRAPAGGV